MALSIYSVRHAVRAFREISEKNRATPSLWRRFWNWPFGMIWSAYLLVFSFGLLINNLILN